jgi:hypothetical protein
VHLAREWKGALKTHGGWWFGQMSKRFRAPLTPYGQANPHKILHNRTGALRNSLNHKVEGTSLKSLRLRLSTDSPYANLQEHGGVIKPRRGKFLAIPADDNLTPAGAPRYTSPRQLPQGRFVELPSGQLWFVLDTPGDTKFMFAMRKQVVIPGPKSPRKGPSRLGMKQTALGKESQRQLQRRIVVGTRRAMRKAAI